MAGVGDPHLEVAILLHPSLLQGRTRLGQHVQGRCH